MKWVETNAVITQQLNNKYRSSFFFFFVPNWFEEVKEENDNQRSKMETVKYVKAFPWTEKLYSETPLIKSVMMGKDSSWMINAERRITRLRHASFLKWSTQPSRLGSIWKLKTPTKNSITFGLNEKKKKRMQNITIEIISKFTSKNDTRSTNWMLTLSYLKIKKKQI